MKKIILIVSILTLSIGIQADPTSENDIYNQAPMVQSFSVYTDIGIVLDATIFDMNEGADVNYTRISIYENESLTSSIVCYFETPTNLTLVEGGTHLEYALIFKRLTPTEAIPITSGLHIYEINASDDDGLYNASTYIHNLSGEPHYTNLNPQGSYVHRTKENPALEDIVGFGVYIIDYNTPPENITVKFHYSTNEMLSWNNITMIYDDMLEYWKTTLGPYLYNTKAYYYVIADDGSQQNRTPATQDTLTWSNIVTEEHYIILYKGWNLISFNLEPDISASDLLSNPYITSIIRFKPDTQALDTAIKGGANDFNLDYEWGYYVYSTISQSYQLQGDLVLNQTLILYKDWNLYGVSTIRSCSSITSRSSIEVIVARTFYGGYPTFKEGYTSDFDIYKEFGYWFYSTEAMQWHP